MAEAEELWLTGPPAPAEKEDPSAMQDQNGHCRCCALINTLKRHALKKHHNPAMCPSGPGQSGLPVYDQASRLTKLAVPECWLCVLPEGTT
ncbi:hypothetical protein AA18895_1579 [Acetobacter ghanensis DSM 18895]|nr:hypothetical protein AA18895_1579 [Acetobacter ghanensis DSM 18895]